MTDQLTERQLGLSVLAGLSAPLVIRCGESAWPASILGLALAGFGMLLMSLAMRRTDGMPKQLQGAYFLWTILLMAKAADLSRACFQDSTGFIPLILLGLSAAASHRGAETCGRVSAILWVLQAVLMGSLLAFAAADFRWIRFAGSHGRRDGWLEIAALGFSPAALAVLLPAGKYHGLRWGYWAAAGFGIAASVVCCGVLGSLRGRLDQPFYQMIQGVSAFGTAERLEALLSSALCVGYFTALSLLGASASAYLRTRLPERETGMASVLVSVAALCLVLPAAALPAGAWIWMGAFFCIFSPCGIIFLSWEKSRRKTKKALDKGGGA